MSGLGYWPPNPQCQVDTLINDNGAAPTAPVIVGQTPAGYFVSAAHPATGEYQLNVDPRRPVINPFRDTPEVTVAGPSLSTGIIAQVGPSGPRQWTVLLKDAAGAAADGNFYFTLNT